MARMAWMVMPRFLDHLAAPPWEGSDSLCQLRANSTTRGSCAGYPRKSGQGSINEYGDFGIPRLESAAGLPPEAAGAASPRVNGEDTFR